MQYAEENHIQIYLDFFVTRNAFVLDYLAEKLQEKGFTRGVLSCDEGFVRNLDDRGTAFSFPVTSRVGQVIYPSATLNYSSPQSLVRLHNYPDQGQKDGRYYEFDDGVIVNGYVNLSDGLCRSVTSDVIGTSSKDGCAPLMLQLLSVYTSQKGDLSSLSCSLLYSDGNKLLYKGDGLSLTDLYADETIAFQAESIS